MNMNTKKQVYWLIVCVVIIGFSAGMASLIERDFGKVDVQIVKIVDQTGYTITAKLFRPVAATPQNKMPGILNMHGYQNDKDVQDGFSIELARRGFVVLATDGLGHGDSGGMFNFGAFFADPTYTMGTNTGYLYLMSLPFVDASNLGVTGHSMGGIDSFKIAAMNPEVKAIVSQDGGFGTPTDHNVLDLYPTMADMSGSTANLNPVDPKAFGLTTPVQWDTTYGNFADGTARRAALITSNHHLLTLQSKSVSEAVNWFELALKGGVKDASWIDPANQVYMWKEIFGLIALLVTILSLIPLTGILLAAPFFQPVAQPMPNRHIPSTRMWWLFAAINALIGGLLYLFVTAPNYGANILGKIPFMRLNNMGNGLAIWFLANAIVFAILFFIWYRTSAKKVGITMYDMGVSFDKEKTKFDWGILGKTLLLGVILFAWMYILEGISQWALGEEFRFAWPYMRQFSDPQRFGLFLIYLIPALAFFLLNGGIFLFGQARQKEYGGPAKTQWMWWLKNLFAGLFGLFLIWAIQYLPWMLFHTGAGFPQTVDPSWAIWPLMLWVYIPEFVVLLFMLTWFYRRTGRIYLGSLMISSLAMWFLAAGTVVGL
jgi:dienelactone hydrolase